MKPRFLFLAAGLLVAEFALMPRFDLSMPQTESGCISAPCPPPPPAAGQLGGPLVGLSTSQASLWTTGYFTFNIKWDPSRGLGPVFTQTACFNCHGGGNNTITNCKFNPPGVACVAGGSSNILGTRYGKFNSDGTFNYLDGTGTFPENEGGPVMHGQTVSQFGTLFGCSAVNIASSPTGATESGTTVTITTTSNHHFQAGQRMAVSGVKVSGYNGNFTILAIPSPTIITYTNTSSGLKASGGGSANNQPHEIVPADATTANAIRSPQLYGLGLVDSIPEATILANSGVNKGLGITGVANMVPDENGNIHAGRFGQKSTFPDLFQFTESAFFNELGITNKFNLTKHLPQGLPFAAKCNPDTESPNDVNGNDLIPSYQFNEMLAPVAPTGSNTAGKTVFETTGCNLCHIESMTTGPNIKLVTDLNGGLSSVVTPLSNVAVNLYSDLLLHDMGPGNLAASRSSRIQQGQATLTQWRTAPLVGIAFAHCARALAQQPHYQPGHSHQGPRRGGFPGRDQLPQPVAHG